MNNKRNLRVDIVSGFLIIYMIFTHICQLSFNVGWPVYIYSLKFFYAYMFFFFLRSGYYFYPIPNQKSCLKKNATSLLKPYLKYSLLSYLIYLWVEESSSVLDFQFAVKQPLTQIAQFGAFAGNLPLWFLLTLFLVKVIYNFIHQYANTLVWFLLTLTVTLVLQYTSNHYDLLIPYTVGSTFVALAIYSVGVLLKEYDINIYKKPILWISCAIYALSLFIDLKGVDIRSNSCGGNCVPWFIASLASCILALNMAGAQITPPLLLINLKCVFAKMNIMLENVGRNSMLYFVWHWIVLLIVRKFFYAFNFTDNRYLLICMVIVCAISLPLIVKCTVCIDKIKQKV